MKPVRQLAYRRRGHEHLPLATIGVKVSQKFSFQKIRDIAYLNIICGASGEDGMEGVISRDKKAGKIDEELASNIEKHQEEIRPN